MPINNIKFMYQIISIEGCDYIEIWNKIYFRLLISGAVVIRFRSSMTAISIFALAAYFSDKSKLFENHYKSDHVIRFHHFPNRFRETLSYSIVQKDSTQVNQSSLPNFSA